MNKKIALCVIAILVMALTIIIPCKAEAVTVNVKTPKRVDTLSVTKKWYHPRPNKGDYQKQKIVAKGKTYKGMRIIAEAGKHYNFSRYSFLADGKPKHMSYKKIKYIGKYAEPQGVAIVRASKKSKTYMYVQMSFNHGNNKRKGRIVRYDLAVINKYVNRKNKHNRLFKALIKSNKYRYTLNTSKTKRKRLRNQAHKKLNKVDYKLYCSVVLGPKFKTGHGQSFGYNPRGKKYLFNASYRLKHDYGKKAHLVRLQTISRAKLKPIKTRRFSLRISKSAWFGFIRHTKGPKHYYLQLHDLTFDKSGHFYFSRTFGIRDTIYVNRTRGIRKNYIPTSHEKKFSHDVGQKVQIYQGTLTKKSVKVRLVQQVSNAIGTVGQGLSYSGKNNRVYLTYDSAFMSFPVFKCQKN